MAGNLNESVMALKEGDGNKFMFKLAKAGETGVRLLIEEGEKSSKRYRSGGKGTLFKYNLH